ncbi:helix-turn-helix transcriptional regulator [Phycicoccus sp. M110.8]|uniref:helix-turn-helix transcriptional regulator n=1 Tax=Phycicoccus sp. M110.8 TaxID=3075433 RepID=UPI0028FDB6DB|nr:helix-turn-helix transcriptional regulator [Phycicoccus sp. M110.8]MDU0313833.1 helix-turn-helix transcriptional regulator [Phycicoccus sp. M110.8]
MTMPVLPVTPRPFSVDEQQAVLDAAALLQTCRRDWAQRLSEGPRDGGRIIAHGDLDAGLYDDSTRWTVLLSATCVVSAPFLRASLPHQRYLVSQGLRAETLFDHDRVGEQTLDVLQAEQDPTFRLALVPLQMKIVDGREVVLQGPNCEGRPTLMAIAEPRTLSAAWVYWRAMRESSVPVPPAPGEGDGLTVRQRRIVTLLRQDLTDEAVARHLGCSVRTVRGDVAQIMERVGAHSRFAVAHRLASTAARG